MIGGEKENDMDFKSQLKNAESNKEKKLLNDLVDNLYDRIKRDCMQTAEWGYNSTNIYIKKLFREQLSYGRFLESDYNVIFRHREDGYELDFEDMSLWVFKDPDKIVEMLKEKLKKDGLLESSKFKYQKTKLFKTESKWVESLWSGNHMATKKIGYEDAVREIELHISWNED